MIYADYNGSAPICADVKEYLIKRLETGPFANPNSIHQLGQKTLMGMENARAICAKALGAKPKHIIFNSGSTEGITHAFHTVVHERKDKKYILISGIEHSAVINVAKYYAHECSKELIIVPVKCNGEVQISFLEDFLNKNAEQTITISIMAANNETGVIQPYKEISDLCQKHNIPYICDTTQLIGKDEFNFMESGVDYAFLSGHKIGALTGSGLMLAKHPEKVLPLIIGGGQERNLRGGTQNYLGNETLAVGMTYFQKNLCKVEALKNKRIEFENRIRETFPKTVILGSDANRLASTTYVAYPGIHGQAVQIELESQGIYVTTSSACSDNQPVTSKVLKAMDVTDDIGRGVVRISLGLCSPLSWYDDIFEALKAAYLKLEKISNY